MGSDNNYPFSYIITIKNTIFMRDILIAYIMGANQTQLEDLSKHIMKRQTNLRNTREMNLKIGKQESIKTN